jgi:hypothetical protein
LGRACGYEKESTVIFSEDNAGIFEDWEKTDGGYIYKTCPHSMVVTTDNDVYYRTRRGPKTNQIRIEQAMKNDPNILPFIERVEREVIQPNLNEGEWRTLTEATKNAGDDTRRYTPYLKIAVETGLFPYLESEECRARWFPHLREFRIVRPGETVMRRGITYRYEVNRNGDVAVSFRHSIKAHRSSRGLDQRDKDLDGNPIPRGMSPADRLAIARQIGHHLQPQINMEKRHPHTGELIDDRNEQITFGNAAERRAYEKKKVPGKWFWYTMTFPLLRPVEEKRLLSSSGDNPVAVARGEENVWDRHTQDDLRELRDRQKTMKGRLR